MKRLMLCLAALALVNGIPSWAEPLPPLWQIYQDALLQARYVDLTHTVEPDSTVWKGFGPQQFAPSVEAESGRPFSYERDGFEATRYQLSTDQLGTQLDPPAHWNPNYPAIDEIPSTYTLRPLVVISIVEKVRQNPGYSLEVADIEEWESRHGKVPAGSVVFVRSDWSRRWGQPKLASEAIFPGVGLTALKYLHLQRQILFHGHEPLDTDCSPTLEGEAWLLQNGYAQAEGVANLDQVPEIGALISIGYAKFRGGTGGYARYIAICPPDWKYGTRIGPGDAPLPKKERPLRWENGLRQR